MNALRLKLAPREIEVLILLAQGESHKTAAAKLGLSSRTIDVYASRIRYRVGAVNMVRALYLLSE